jgi:hypothetical protein
LPTEVGITNHSICLQRMGDSTLMARRGITVEPIFSALREIKCGSL